MVAVGGDYRGRLMMWRACDGDGLEGRMVGSLWVEDAGRGEMLRGKELRLVILGRMLLMSLWESLALKNWRMVSNLEKLLMVVWWLLVGRSIDVESMVRGY